MIKNGVANKLWCRECGKPLVLARCQVCKGRGSVRTAIFFRQTCSQCDGSGKAYSCLDAAAHAQQKIMQVMDKPKRFQVTRNCPRCGDKGWVPTSNPSYRPFAGYAGSVGKVPCPLCGGRR